MGLVHWRIRLSRYVKLTKIYEIAKPNKEKKNMKKKKSFRNFVVIFSCCVFVATTAAAATAAAVYEKECKTSTKIFVRLTLPRQKRSLARANQVFHFRPLASAYVATHTAAGIS